MAAIDEDAYVSQLRDVFKSCDQTGIGFLDKEELKQLCSKLHLQEESDALVRKLMHPGERARVGFEEFKEGFVAVLSESVNDLASTDGEEELPLDDDDLDIKPQGTEKVNDTGQKSENGFNASQVVRELQFHPITSPDCITYESEAGRMNRSASSMDFSHTGDEEQHLRAVWKELGVGQDGALSLEELSVVCRHIGMEHMTQQELEQLFDKLDVDRDGKVGFHEFLNGLFQHGSSSHHSPSPRQLLITTPRQKPHFSLSPATPLAGLSDSEAGIFSTLDSEGTGYVKSDTIVHLWERLGISQGIDILEYLQFNLSSNVNLSELTRALHQELHCVEEDNAIYQAALASLEHEVRHTKSSHEQLRGEHTKCQSDLTEALQRIGILVAEGDERHSLLEKSKQDEMTMLEKKYQGQLKSLQLELDQERDLLSQHASKENTSMQREIDRLKSAEVELKNRVAVTQKENERLDKDLSDITDQTTLLQAQNNRYLRELESARDLKAQLEEMETQADIALQDQRRISELTMQELKEENKDLKDRIDELSSEVANLQQQLLTSRRQLRNSKQNSSDDSSHSLMSEYVPNKNISNDHDVSSNSPQKIRRKLPQSPEDIESIFQHKIDELEKEKLSLVQAHLEEIEKLKSTHSQLKEDLEKLSESSEYEKQELILQKDDEKQEALKAQQTSLEKTFHKELDARLSEERDRLNKLLEETVTSDRLSDEELHRQKEVMEEKLDKLREEMELEHKKDRLLLLERFDEEKAALVDKHRLKVYDYENIFIKGVEGLHGQIKTDFFALLDRHKEEFTEKEKTRIANDSKAEEGRRREERSEEIEKLLQKQESEKRALMRDYEMEKANISNMLTRERIQLEKQYQQEIAELEKTLDEERESFAQQRDTMVASHSREKSSWQRQTDLIKGELTDDIVSQTQSKMEEEFIEQIDRIKTAYDEERTELENRLRQMQKERLEEQRERQRDHSALSQQRDEMNASFGQIKRHRQQLEEENRKQKDEIRTLRLQMDDIRTAADEDLVQTILKAIESQKDLLITTTSDLKQEIVNVNQTLHESVEKSTASSEMQAMSEQLDAVQEKLALTEASLKMAESSHVREVQNLRKQLSQSAEGKSQNQLQDQLQAAEKKVAQLQAAMNTRAAETNKLLSATCDDYKRSLNKMDNEKDAMQRQLKQTRTLLEEQVNKLRAQLEKSAKTDLLVKDLYVENAQLIKALEMTERRQKAAESKVFFLQDKNTELNKVLRMVCPAALG